MTQKLAWSLIGGLAIVSVGLVACNSSVDRKQQRSVAQNVDDKTNEQLKQTTGKDSGRAPTSGDQTDAESNQQEDQGNPPKQDIGKPQETSSDSGKDPQERAGTQSKPEEGTSPLDRASENYQQKEIADPRQQTEPEPVEVHEALVPLLKNHWVRLAPHYEVWVDTKNQQVIFGGRISLTDGLLEMFACPQNTKEHESVVSARSNAEIVHTGLLAVGAEPGSTARWDNNGFRPATGPVCDLTVVWKENGQRKELPAKQMILDRSTDKPLTHDWVFAGSHVWIDPEDPSYREYQANGGDMICVSNFPSAMLDLTIESSDANAGLLFTANPETIPPLGTPVLVIIKPQINGDTEDKRPEDEKKSTSDDKTPAKPKDGSSESRDENKSSDQQKSHDKDKGEKGDGNKGESDTAEDSN